jgi:hypothetical protein
MNIRIIKIGQEREGKDVHFPRPDRPPTSQRPSEEFNVEG